MLRSRQPSHGQLRSTSSGELGPAGQILGSPDALDVLLVLRTGLGLKKPLLHIGDLSGRSLHLVGRERLEFPMPRDRPFTIHLFRSSTFVRLAQTPSAVHRVSAPNPGVPTMFKDGVQLRVGLVPRVNWGFTDGVVHYCRPVARRPLPSSGTERLTVQRNKEVLAGGLHYERGTMGRGATSIVAAIVVSQSGLLAVPTVQRGCDDLRH